MFSSIREFEYLNRRIEKNAARNTVSLVRLTEDFAVSYKNMKLSLIFLLCFAAFPAFVYCQITGDKSAMKDEIPTIAFCEMVKNPQAYFDKTIRITAVYTQATEGRYLNDDENCPLSHDDQIGAESFKTNESEVVKHNAIIQEINSVEYGHRAKVTVIGKLRNISLRGFSWYRYRFDISRFETVSQVVEEYKGSLDGTITYRAEVRKDKVFGINFVNSYRIKEHYATRIEWTNLKKFPELKKFETKKIVFTVLSNEIKQMTVNRWNETIRCKIIRVE